MLSSALGLAKGNDETKVGISVQIPKSLKEDFEELCKKNGVSMASMLQALVQIAVNEDKGIDTHLVTVSGGESYKKELFDKYLSDHASAIFKLMQIERNPDGSVAYERDEEEYYIRQSNVNGIVQKLHKIGGIQ